MKSFVLFVKPALKLQVHPEYLEFNLYFSNIILVSFLNMTLI